MCSRATASALARLDAVLEVDQQIKSLRKTYEGCSLILVICLISPKPASIPEENYLVVICDIEITQQF